MRNVEERVAEGFGDEWSRFDQTELSEEDHTQIWRDYFAIFPWDSLPANPEGLDVGCGSGRWARLVAPRVGKLICVDPSEQALAVAAKTLSGFDNVECIEASANEIPVADGSQDFAYSLGVLHHVPDTAEAVCAVVRKLKPGAPFLLYLYYRFDNRPWWFRRVWQCSEIARAVVSKMPYAIRYLVSQSLAVTLYWPLARLSLLVERLGRDPSLVPLAYYRDKGFYVMRTDALDRFGTRLEKRFTRDEIVELLEEAGCTQPVFSEEPPFWVVVARKT